MAIPQHIAKGVLRAGGPVVIVAGTNLAKYIAETPDDPFGRLRTASVTRVATERPQRVLETEVVWHQQAQQHQRQQKQKSKHQQQQYHQQYHQQYQQSFQYQKQYQYDQPDQEESQSQQQQNQQHQYDYDSSYQYQYDQPPQWHQNAFSTIDPLTHDFSFRRRGRQQFHQPQKVVPQPNVPEQKTQVSPSRSPRVSVISQPPSPVMTAEPSPVPSPVQALAPTSSRLLQDFILEEEIGRGGFGRVFRAKNRFDLLEYATKVVINQLADKSSYNEARILAKINHPNIVRYHCAWLEPLEGELRTLLMQKTNSEVSSVSNTPLTPLSQSVNSLSKSSSSSGTSSFVPPPTSLSSLSSLASLPSGSHLSAGKVVGLESMGSECSTIPSSVLVLQMELLSNWTLADWIAVDRGPAWSQTVVMVFSQILEALDYIHSRGIVHRDVKPSNVFFAQAPSQTEMPLVKLGDFGLSMELRSPKRKERRLSFGSRNTAGVGTAIYASPEQNSGTSCDGKADMFALGIMLFECLAPRFNTMSERLVVLQGLRKGVVPPAFVKQYPQAAELVLSLISSDPNHRPGAREVLALPLFHISPFPQLSNSSHAPVQLNLVIRQLEEDLRRRDATIAQLHEKLRSLEIS